MKKILFKLSLFILFLLFKNAAVSQINDLNMLEKYMEIINDVFSDIDVAKINTGILIERAPAIIDIDNFNIKNADTTICNVWDWLELHKQLSLAHINPSDLQMKKTLIADYPYNIDIDAPIQLGIIFYDYNKINDRAIENGYIVVDEENMKIRDVSGQHIIPYDTITCFAAAFLTDETFTTGTYTFNISPDFFISNKVDYFDELYIDFDDGQGYVRINYGDIIVNYTFPGEKVLKTKALSDGKEYVGHTSIDVIEEEFHMITINTPDFGPEFYGIAEYGVWYGCNNNNEIRKPYIIVSGFDPYDKNRITNEIDKINLFNVSNKDGFLDRLRDDGFDIIIYRSTYSMGSLLMNAVNLFTFIETINQLKTTNEELIIVGASMGGLIARYALTLMEYNNIPHHTKLFVSVDSPHEGANIPLGFQTFIKCLSLDLNLYIPIVVELLLRRYVLDKLDCTAAKEMLLYHYVGLNKEKAAPANERLEYLQDLDEIGGFPQNCRSIAISMGSGIGVNQGFEAGQLLLKKNRGSLPGMLLNLVLPTFVVWKSDVYAIPDNTRKMIYDETVSLQPVPGLPMFINLIKRKIFVNNTLPLDNAPGAKQGLHNLEALDANGLVNFLTLLGTVEIEPNYDCFIPSYSALGLSVNNPHTNIKELLNSNRNVNRISDNMYMSLNNNSPSYFDFMYIEDINDFHIYHPETHEGVFTTEMLSTMKDFSSPDDLYIDDKVIPGGSSFSFAARNTITAGNGADALLVESGDVIVEKNGKLELYAGEAISLKPGFHAKKSSEVFVATKNDIFCPIGTFSAPIVQNAPPPKISKNYLIDHELEGDEEQEEYDINPSMETSMFNIIKQFEEPVILFPNPTTDYLNISSNKNENHAYIYDTNGNLIHNVRFNRNVSLNMFNYPAGIYIVKVIQENGNVVNKTIIKQ